MFTGLVLDRRNELFRSFFGQSSVESHSRNSFFEFFILTIRKRKLFLCPCNATFRDGCPCLLDLKESIFLFLQPPRD